MATITAAVTTANWNTNGAWVGSVQPGAGDDVVIPSGAIITIPNGGSVLGRSLTVQSGGRLDWFNSVTAVLTLGDGTAGSGNSVINISSGATINANNGTLNIASTSATQQTITTGGKILPTLSLGSGASPPSILLADALTVNGKLFVTRGTFNTGNYSVTCTAFDISNANARTITLGSSTITCTASTEGFTATLPTNLTWTTCTATIVLSGANSATRSSSFTFTGLNIVYTGGGNMIGNKGGGQPTYDSMTVTGTNSKYDTFTPANTTSSAPTIVNTLTVNGNSSINRIFIIGGAVGTPVVVTAGAVSFSNVDFRDIQSAGASAPWSLASITGGSGDSGGNSGITFTTAVPQIMSGGGSWSDVTKWTSRVPLPQDNATITGSSAVTVDMPRLGADINMSGYSGTMTLTSAALTYELYGSVVLGASMSWGANPNTFQLNLAGRGTHTITSNGQPFFPAGSNASLGITGAGGSYTLQDALSYKSPVAASFSIIAGSFYSNNYSIDCGRFIYNGTITRNIYLGTSTVNINYTSAGSVIIGAATGLTSDMLSATFNIVSASANTRTIDLGSAGIGVLNYTVTASTGQMNFASNGYVGTFNFSDSTNARTIGLTANITMSFNVFNAVGASGRVVTVNSLTSGTPAFLEILSDPSVTDYLSVKDIYAVIPNKFYVGTHSTDVSGNTNVVFSSTPSGPYISLRADNQLNNASSISITFPYGLIPIAGRKIVVAYAGNNNAGTITPPTGFTQVASYTSGGQWINLFEKVSDGTESTLTFSISTVPQLSGLKAFTLGGFTSVPILDVTDTNAVTTATSMSTAGSAPSNTANPALALAVFQANNNVSTSVSATNSFGILRDSTELSSIRALTKLLTSNAAVSTTYTWTTARNVISLLAVYKNDGVLVDITKSAQYVVTRPVTITKTAGYAVTRPLTITKSAQYSVSTTTTITKSASYSVARLTTVTKSAAYSVARLTTVTKTADYLVLTTPTISRIAIYLVSSLQTIQLGAISYVSRDRNILLDINYSVEAGATLTKQASYAVAIQLDETLDSDYSVARSSDITLAADYSIISNTQIVLEATYRVNFIYHSPEKGETLVIYSQPVMVIDDPNEDIVISL